MTVAAMCLAFDFDALDAQIFEAGVEWDLKISDPVMLVSKSVSLPS